jgi:hypothetical protein
MQQNSLQPLGAQLVTQSAGSIFTTSKFGRANIYRVDGEFIFMLTTSFTATSNQKTSSSPHLHLRIHNQLSVKKHVVVE